MRLSLELIDTEQQIQKAILSALLGDANKIMLKAVKQLKRRIPNIIESAIVSQPEYSSLIGGRLRDEFGVPDAASKIDNLLKLWKNIEVTYQSPKIRSGQIISSISIEAIRSDYSDVLSSPSAKQKTKKGQSLAWLDWLLIQGDKIIIKEYEISGGEGRAGRLVMKKTVTGKWGVPSGFAGSPNDNWITRAIQSVSGIIDRTLAEALQ
jgi:hypothetical protein